MRKLKNIKRRKIQGMLNMNTDNNTALYDLIEVMECENIKSISVKGIKKMINGVHKL